MKTIAGLAASLITAAATAEFRINPDESVSYNGVEYQNFSQYFDTVGEVENKTCLTEEIEQPIVPIVDTARMKADCGFSSTTIKDEYWPEAPVQYTIPVYFHVIEHSSGIGIVSDSNITAQMAVLNEDFWGVTNGSFNIRIQFELLGVDRTVNDRWFNSDDYRTDMEYKTALGIDTRKALNIYTNTARGYLGYAYYPSQMAGYTADGVNLMYKLVSGRNGTMPGYDKGRVLVHEIGHYLGLRHVFSPNEGNFITCENSYTEGDLIIDTPSQSKQIFGCPISSNTCDSPDPIHNFMNYTSDSCGTEFTPEQANRIMCSLINYRPGLDPTITPEEEEEFIHPPAWFWYLVHQSRDPQNIPLTPFDPNNPADPFDPQDTP